MELTAPLRLLLLKMCTAVIALVISEEVSVVIVTFSPVELSGADCDNSISALCRKCQR